MPNLTILSASFRTSLKPARLFAIGLCLSIAACETPPPKAPAPAPVVVVPPPPPAAHPLDKDLPAFLRLPNQAADVTPVRVGIILPFGSSAAATRNLATAMMNAAELALFDGKNKDIVLMTADEGNGGAGAAAAAQKLLAQGAEIIIGPLFGTSVSAVAPIAKDRGIPVLAFSTEKSVAGNGTYLLSFLPQSEVSRVVAYAVAQGHHNLAAMVPQNDYGQVVAGAFNDAVKAAGANNVAVEYFAPTASAVMAPAQTIAKSNADAVIVAQGGTVLKAIGPSLAFNGLDTAKVKLLGTGLWYDPTIGREQTLNGGWFAAPEPTAADNFNAKYKDAYGATPPQLATLAYDAISLVALLAPGPAYHRFTQAALMDPNGFAGVDGIFRFRPDGTSQRGLAVLEVGPDGFNVVSPAPKTFENSPS
jgi:ABC-type branched-subunit amino acid transport system substrate-binding protein